MIFTNFIAKSEKYNTIENHENAPLFIKKFHYEKGEAKLRICVAGLYRLYINGADITKGYLAPYISNPDHILFYDEYAITERLIAGENEIRVILGNGFANCRDNGIWKFEKAAKAPSFSAEVEIDGEIETETDLSWEVADSNITFDDLRCGEWYDARIESKDFGKPIAVERPKGEIIKNEADAISCGEILKPTEIIKNKKGYVYDFGRNDAGICRLKINGFSGQVVDMTFGEVLNGGELDLRSITFEGRSIEGYVQRDRYICRDGYQEYEPSFTYHGFRYVLVEGIEKEQATPDLLEYKVLHSDIKTRGKFTCDNEVINKIQQCAVVSDLSNFYYYPTDCPHREKNGWTGDAALSAEQLLYNFDCGRSLEKWLLCVRKSQEKSGKLPGIIPTTGWGYEWGNGPAWDNALIETTYEIYRFTGNERVITDNINAIDLYFGYLETRRNKDGLFDFGLGDWVEAGTYKDSEYSTPTEITDTLTCIEFSGKTAFLARETGRKDVFEKATRFRKDLIRLFRKKYVKNGEITCKTQTALSFCFDQGILAEDEKERAKRDLLKDIKERDGHFKVGVLGAKRLFKVLSELGESETAFKLITNPTFPSYAYNIQLGATSLWETFFEYEECADGFFRKDGGKRIYSFNHHFWGTVSAWFYEYLGGLKVIKGYNVNVSPEIISSINRVKTEYAFKGKKIEVQWERKGEEIELTVNNEGFFGEICVRGFVCDRREYIMLNKNVKKYLLIWNKI